jgi:hypothetical protein
VNLIYDRYLKGPYTHCNVCGKYVTQPERDHVNVHRQEMDYSLDIKNCERFDKALSPNKRIPPDHTVCWNCYIAAAQKADIRFKPKMIIWGNPHYLAEEDE